MSFPLARAVRTASPARIAFASVMIAVGIIGIATGDFAAVWAPVPKSVPARTVLAYALGFACLAGGIGLLWRRTAHGAAAILFAMLAIWLLASRVAHIALDPPSQEAWSGFGETADLTAGAWILYAGPAIARDVRAARSLYAIALIIFGIAHFRYVAATASLVPAWLPWHTFWAYFTGSTFIAAGVAIALGWRARWAAILSTAQMGMFTLLVWVPIVVSGANAFQWSELLISIALTAGGWVVAESYRATA